MAVAGGWPSPITASLLVQGAARIDEVVVDRAGGDPDDAAVVWWAEGRPAERGRTVVLRAGREVTPPDVDVRSKVHEYGGGAWWVDRDVLVYVDAPTQRVWRLAPHDAAPVALTDAGAVPGTIRHADLRVTPDQRWVLAVRETHDRSAHDTTAHPAEPVNELVAIDLAGSGRVVVLATGADFYSSPRPSPDGTRLAWLEWSHPDMPWDATRLVVATFDSGRSGGSGGDADPTARDLDIVAGAATSEALVQPEWTADGRLLVVSDRDEWWNLYEARTGPGPIDALTPVFGGEFEIALPPWVFGQARYAVLDDGRVVTAAARPPGDVLLVDDGDHSHLVALPYSSIAALRAVDDHRVAAVVASWQHEPHVVVIDVDSGAVATVGAPRDLGLDRAYFAPPRVATFPTTDGAEAHALYYAPAHPDHALDDGERPPLVVMAHGGPTSAARRQCNLALRYWTSRGFAVLDVDYRGSTGYGRTYRRALDGRWGVADVDDCVAAARAVCAQGLADPARLAIRGGSAGGFTVLCALTFHDVFTAGASLYGIADLEALARDTHKFESRYLDRLVAPYPQQRAVYEARSPIHHLDRLATPMIVLQGLDDAVVPPNQAQMMADGLRAKGVPHAYLTFAGEGHGFRRAETIVRAIEAELSFYAQIWGFEPADPVEPVEVIRR